MKVDALENQTFEGTVVEIAQKALIRNQGSEAETTSFPVTVALTARPPGVLPGMSSEVKIIAESRESALVVPVQAVTVRPEKMLNDVPAAIEGQKLERYEQKKATLLEEIQRLQAEVDESKAQR